MESITDAMDRAFRLVSGGKSLREVAKKLDMPWATFLKCVESGLSITLFLFGNEEQLRYHSENVACAGWATWEGWFLYEKVKGNGLVFFSHAPNRRWNRSQSGERLLDVGRPPALSPGGVEKMRVKGYNLGKRGRAFTSKTFAISFVATAKEEARSYNKNESSVKVPSPSTANRYRRLIAERKVRKPNTQNMRREQVFAKSVLSLRIPTVHTK